MSYLDKVLFNNFISLTFLKTSSFVLGWLLYPFIIRLVGINNFGEVILTQSVMLYFVTFTDYGFSLSAPREIARLHQSNPKECQRQISNFLFTQILLGLLSFIILFGLVQWVTFFNQRATLMYLSFMIVVGQVSLPIWFFQGVEQMSYLVWLNWLAKLILIICTLLWIHTTQDYLWFNFFWGAGNFIAGLVAWVIIFKRFKIRLQLPSFNRIYLTLQRDFQLFVANLTNMIVFNSTIIILGIFTSPQTVGFYSIADRIFLVTRQIAVVAHQTIYPRVAKLAEESLDSMKLFFRNFWRLTIIVLVPFCGLLFLLAPQVVYIFAGERLIDTTQFVRILSFTPLLAVVNLPAVQGLLVTNKERVYTQLSLIGVIFHIALSFLLIHFYQGYGAAIGLLITEVFLLIIFNLIDLRELK